MFRLRHLALIIAAGAFSACGSPKGRTPIAPPEALIFAGPNADLSDAGTLWHLRGVLNVAALKCGGETPQQYNLMLKAHARAFTRAQARLKREYRRDGSDWQDRFDDRQTQLYNHFAHPSGERQFCAAAQPVLLEIAAVEQEDLPRYAARALVVLDRALGR